MTYLGVKIFVFQGKFVITPSDSRVEKQGFKRKFELKLRHLSNYFPLKLWYMIR